MNAQTTDHDDTHCWTEYDMAADDCARRGLAGKPGDPLLNLLGDCTCRLIDADPEAFERRVSDMAYARAMRNVERDNPSF